jgi:hypothetical protein
MTQTSKWTLVLGVWLIAAGLVLLTIGYDGLPEPGNPYPNTQHITPTPTPNWAPDLRK